jgi:pimeloyl-ACP methyl ester carboxylesterase
LEDPEKMESEEIAVQTLQLMNTRLKPHALAEYQSEDSTLSFAHQSFDFWQCDFVSRAPRIKAPVLLIGAEYDRIASTEGAQYAAQLLPRSKFILLPGATHYCMYDSADRVAGLIEEFLRESSV